jgi:hypothetical protein
MRVCGLDDYRLTVASLERLGARTVTLSLQLKGVSLSALIPLSPRERDARLRATLKRQLARLTRDFPEANLKSRNPKRGSWTLDGRLPANKVRRLARQPEVAELWVSAISGRSKRSRPAKEGWFCVWGIVAIQVEGQRSGMMQVEDRLVLVKALSPEHAVARLGPTWNKYAEPYLNPAGYLVRWQCVEIKDVFALFDGQVSPKGTEVYSRLRTVKVKPEYQWRSSSAPSNEASIRSCPARQTRRRRS